MKRQTIYIGNNRQVLVNQGEFFASSGIIFLQPDYVTRLLKPLVDHRRAFSRAVSPIA